MSRNSNITSFVVRFTQDLWQDAEEEPHVRWRGHIRHVQGNDENRFTDFAEAASFMQRHLTQMTVDTLALSGKSMSQEKMLQESFKIWEQFASSYTNMMLQAMGQGVRQSKAFKEQIDETTQRIMRAWQFPFQSNSDPLQETVRKLQAQVEQLSKKVETLEQKVADWEKS